MDINDFLIQLMVLNKTNKTNLFLEDLYKRFSEQSNFRIQHLKENNILTQEQIGYIIESKTLTESQINKFGTLILNNMQDSDFRHREDILSQKLSMHSYREKKSIIKVYEKLGYTNIQFIDKHITSSNPENPDLRIILAEKDSEVCVVFRGSSTFNNVTQNLKFANLSDLRRPNKKGRFHRGFKEYLDLCKEDILNKIDQEYSLKGKKLHYIGHSLGGALSLGLALHKKPDKITTFGAPRISSKEQYTSYFDSIDRRKFNNYTDIVSRLPFNFLGFDTLFEEITLDSKYNSFSFLKNHSMTKYGNQIIERFITGQGFSEYCISSLFNIDNFDLVKKHFSEEIEELSSEILLEQQNKNQSLDESVQNLFQKTFNLTDQEFLNYKEAIINPNKTRNAFRVIQSFTEDKLDQLIDKFNSNIRLEYRINKFNNLKNENIFEKSLYLFAVLGTAITSFIKTGNEKLLSYTLKRINSKKESPINANEIGNLVKSKNDNTNNRQKIS